MTSFKLASRSIVACLTLGAALATANVNADPITRGEVIDSLGGFEHAPDTSAVRAWGATGAAHLMSVANDVALPLHVRVRAVHALRAYGTMVPVRTFLRALAGVTGQNLFILRASLDALVEGFNDTVEVARYLADPRVDVRDGAVWSLAASRDPAARSALAARLAVETDANVRLTLTTALRNGTTVPPVPTAPSGSVTVATTRAIGR